MKIIIVAEDADLVREVVQKQGHAVVAETDDPAHLQDLILEHTPHLVFWEKAEHTTREVERLASVFTIVRFVALGFERGTTWTQTIRHALRGGKIRSPWTREFPEKRQIVFDLKYYSFFRPTTLRPSGKRTNGEDSTAVEAMRLSRLLRAASKVRDQASLHMEAMSAVSLRSGKRSFTAPHSEALKGRRTRDNISGAR